MARMRLLIAGASLAGAMAAVSAPAWATVSIAFQDPVVNGGLKTPVGISGPLFAAFAGGYGVFNANITSGVDPAVLGELLDSNSLDASNISGGTLNVFVTTSDITSPVGVNDFTSALTSNKLNEWLDGHGKDVRRPGQRPLYNGDASREPVLHNGALDLCTK